MQINCDEVADKMISLGYEPTNDGEFEGLTDAMVDALEGLHGLETKIVSILSCKTK